MEIQCKEGVDPLDPDVLRQMQEGKKRIEQECRVPDTLVDAGDLTDTLTIAGFRARPFSAGLIATLEMVKAPVLFSAKKATLPDMLVLLWALLADVSEDELVELATDGYPAMKKAAMKWSFGLSVGKMNQLTDEMPTLLERINATMLLYGQRSGGGKDGDKKKSVTG